MASMMQSAVMGRALVAPVRGPAKASRSAVVCTASAEDARRAVVSLAAAASVTLGVVGSSFAAAPTAPPLSDDTKKNAGVQLIYEARDLDVDNKPKPGESTRFALQKLTLAQTKARVTESLTRLATTVTDYSNKKYWTPAQNELRRQVGYLRFDLNALVEAKGSGDAEADALVKSVEELDFAFRKKSPEMAAKALAAVAANSAAVKAAFL